MLFLISRDSLNALKPNRPTLMPFTSIMVLRELPKDAQICRIVYLRQQHRAGKLTKDERAECYRRGWEVIKLRDRAKEKAAADNKDYFKQKQNELRAARGLPPL